MRTFRSEARPKSTLAEIFEGAVAALIQDGSEYGITGFAGGVVACFAAIALRLMRNPIADAMIAPAVILIAVVTFAISAEAFARGAENLQPDAAAASRAVILRLAAHLGPWLPLSAALFVAVLAMRLFCGVLGFWPNAAISMALLMGSLLYAYPRGFLAVAIAAGVQQPRDAVTVSVGLVRSGGAIVVMAWAIAGLPTIAVGLIGLAAGFGAASAGLAALVVVGSMPLSAAMMSLLFEEARSRL
ncbi:MAG: hypothetical protein M3P30_15350 [Chloroflexota bacterium]|nr:hypothetical protein [Chloroflexota bacterium]